MEHKRDYIFLFILNILDILTTITFLEYSIASEGNPLMAYILNKFGYTGLVGSKFIFLGFLGLLLAKDKYREEIRESKSVKFCMRFLILAYIFVVVLNLSVVIPYFI